MNPEDSRNLEEFWKIVEKIYDNQRELHGLSSEMFLAFTLDGRLVEHLGKYYAAEAYTLSPLLGHGRRRKFLRTNSAPITPVEIHTTQDERPVYIGSPNPLARHLLVFFLSKTNRFQVVYNGPRSIVDEENPENRKEIDFDTLVSLNRDLTPEQQITQYFRIP